MRLKRFFIEFAYNGEAYHGWQRQTNALTVQAVMEDCFGKLLKTKICLTGAGRTDTGVHAKQMFAHFDTNKIFKINDLTHLANNFLPIDIRIKSINQVKNEAHARFSALERSYEYHVSNLKDPFNFSFHYYLKILPNLDIMNKAAKILVDYKNFKSFSKSNTDVKTFNCNIKSAEWKLSDNKIIFYITSNRFLRNMVRSIVGTLLEIGLNKINLDEFKKIIESKDRRRAGYSVPANALFLSEVKYPIQIFEDNGKRKR